MFKEDVKAELLKVSNRNSEILEIFFAYVLYCGSFCMAVVFFLNGIQSMQDWRVTTRHGVKQKEEEVV